MRSLIVYFSWTGNVAVLAQHLRARLEPYGEVVTERIEPVKEHGYWGWLARSFVPGWSEPIMPIAGAPELYDLVCLGFPKWTLGCPPLNGFLRTIRDHPGQKWGLFMACGGFDQDRYLRGMAKMVRARGVRVSAVVWVKRRAIREGTFGPILDRFCRELTSCVPAAAPE